MKYHNEADEDADRAPQQVGGPEPQDHPLLTIDGAGCLLELGGLLEHRGDLDLLAVLGRPAAAPRPMRGWGCGWEKRHAVALDPRDQMVAMGQQSANDVTGGIVGIG